MKIVNRLKGASAYLKRVVASRADVVPRGDYDRLQGIYENQVRENQRLAGEVSRLERIGFGLAGQLIKKEDLCKNYVELSESCVSVERELAFLKMEYGDLARTISSVRKHGLYALRVAREARTGLDVVKARAEANAGANSALAEWQKAYAGPLEKRLKAAEQEASALRCVAFSKAVDENLKRDSRAMQVPFAYYGFATHKLYYTPAALEFLGGEKQEHKDDLTLVQLIRPIRREDRTGIINSLKSGKGLKHHKVFTFDDKELKLTTKPFFYDRKPVGVAIFLYDPRFSVTNVKDNLMYRRLQKLFNELSVQFDEIKESAKLGKLQPDIV